MSGVVTRAKRSADVPDDRAEPKPRLARFAAVKKETNTVTANGKRQHRSKTAAVIVKKEDAAPLSQVLDAVPIPEELAVPATPVKSGKSVYKSPVKAALPARAAPTGWHETYTLIQVWLTVINFM